jgi:hypothetical protein
MFPYAWPAFVRTIMTALSDGKPHTHEYLLAYVARAHALTPDQCKLTMANGYNIFVSRVGNALARLVTKRAVIKFLAGEDGSTVYQMTEHGLEVLQRKGKEVKINDF